MCWYDPVIVCAGMTRLPHMSSTRPTKEPLPLSLIQYSRLPCPHVLASGGTIPRPDRARSGSGVQAAATSARGCVILVELQYVMTVGRTVWLKEKAPLTLRVGVQYLRVGVDVAVH